MGEVTTTEAEGVLQIVAMDEPAEDSPPHPCGKRQRAGDDAELLELFQSDPSAAWRVFIDRYADVIYTTLRVSGLDYDEVMERFVYVCEKLVEDDYRRLRSVKHLGERDELTPWLRRVTKNLAINWAISKEGRRRLLKSIEELDALDQAVFVGRFWRGHTPSEIWSALRNEGREVGLLDVFDSLERVESRLSPKKRWRLLAHLLRRSRSVAVAEDRVADSSRRDPERALLRDEGEKTLRRAMERLTPRQRLLLQLRYEESLPISEAARALRITAKEAKASLATARKELRRHLEQADLSVEKVEGPERGARRER